MLSYPPYVLLEKIAYPSSCLNLVLIQFLLGFLNVSENKLWFQPECTGNGSVGQVGPSPRAFHIAIAIDCHMFVFGGRSGGKRFVDF